MIILIGMSHSHIFGSLFRYKQITMMMYKPEMHTYFSSVMHRIVKAIRSYGFLEASSQARIERHSHSSGLNAMDVSNILTHDDG